MLIIEGSGGESGRIPWLLQKRAGSFETRMTSACFAMPQSSLCGSQ